MFHQPPNNQKHLPSAPLTAGEANYQNNHDTRLSDTGVSAPGPPRGRRRADALLKWQHLMAHRRRGARVGHRLVGSHAAQGEGGDLPRGHGRGAQWREALDGERLPPGRAARTPRLQRGAPFPVEICHGGVVHERYTQGFQRNGRGALPRGPRDSRHTLFPSGIARAGGGREGSPEEPQLGTDAQARPGGVRKDVRRGV